MCRGILKFMRFLNVTGLGFQRSTSPLLGGHACCKCSMEIINLF